MISIRRRHRGSDHDGVYAAVTIRKLSDEQADREALERLVERDSGAPLDGVVLVAEVEGALLAALSLADGRVVADPFSRTNEIRSLLELRAAQLRRRWAAPRRSHTVNGRPASRAALAGSPPGAGGRLLQLPR